MFILVYCFYVLFWAEDFPLYFSKFASLIHSCTFGVGDIPYIYLVFPIQSQQEWSVPHHNPELESSRRTVEFDICWWCQQLNIASPVHASVANTHHACSFALNWWCQPSKQLHVCLLTDIFCRAWRHECGLSYSFIE